MFHSIGRFAATRPWVVCIAWVIAGLGKQLGGLAAQRRELGGGLRRTVHRGLAQGLDQPGHLVLVQRQILLAID